MKTRLIFSTTAAIASVLVLTGSAEAQVQRVEAGTLTCTGKGGLAQIIGSKRSLACNFKPISNRPDERYSATITRYGLDLGVTGDITMIWTVLAPASSVARRALAGTYTGASADVSVGLGGGANVLVGGSNRSIALQPISLQGQTGLNIALGVSELRLR
jgi:hypothetical protein